MIIGCYASSLPFLRGVWNLLTEGGSATGSAVPIAIGAVFCAVLVSYIVGVKREKRLSVYSAFVLFILVCTRIFLSIREPIERVHLAEYALLSMMVFWAMSDGTEGWGLCIWAVVVTMELGLADELIQGILPERIYDFNDVLLNAKAAVVGQGMVAFVLRPWEASGRGLGAGGPRSEGSCAYKLWWAFAIVVLLAALNVYIVERGTPTIAADVLKGTGELRYRDGYRFWNSSVACVNGILSSVSLAILLSARSSTAKGARALRAAVVCGLLSPLILLVGWFSGAHFR